MAMLGILRHLVPTSQTAAHKMAVAMNQSIAEGIAERSPLRPSPKPAPTGWPVPELPEVELSEAALRPRAPPVPEALFAPDALFALPVPDMLPPC